MGRNGRNGYKQEWVFKKHMTPHVCVYSRLRRQQPGLWNHDRRLRFMYLAAAVSVSRSFSLRCLGNCFAKW
jgi:hypothetical protein